ncbi:cytochrome P450 CYP12A2-like isoform X2 [Aphidius gifuensis]|uniref:cytochrome P450 CYP12A2-like isoform X2 n=1 Tax=Aphidius gifuensis TaxID=684658 RepID=UPI001CDD1D58|nr:cytochrome P450 CYP12A2-like isoform X2 [Aphidius gifuensis]
MRRCSLFFNQLRSYAELNKPLVASESHDRKISMNQPRSSSALAPRQAVVMSSESAESLLTPSIISRVNKVVLQQSQTPEIMTDKLPLPFEDIPGPAVLRLIEKYWKYVPILGTQLVCSLLLNTFTVGRLTWNKNVTPLKYLFNEYGPVVKINGPAFGSIVMIHKPEHIAQVFKQEGQLPTRSGIDILQHYRINHRQYKFPGPMSMQGADWRDAKVKLDKLFSMHLLKYFDKLDKVSEELTSRIRIIRNRQDEVPDDFNKYLLRWSMECFSVLIFNRRLGFLDSSGLNPSSEPSKIIAALFEAHYYLSKCETGFQVWRFINTPFSKKLFRACDVIDEIIGKFIRQAQNKFQSRSATKFLEPSSETNEGFPILEKLLADQQMHPDDLSTLLMDFILLGVQAVSNTQGFLLYFLAKNQRVQRKLYDEITGVLSSTNSSVVDDETLQQMPYLTACLQESLRLRPSFPYITRLLSKTITLHGYTIPKDTYLIMANQISSRREDNFDEAEKFIPERWLNSEKLGVQEPWSCLPFGHGVRSCLGKQMAETEIKLLTAKLVQNFKIEYDYADINNKFMMVNVPNKPLRFRFVDRD